MTRTRLRGSSAFLRKGTVCLILSFGGLLPLIQMLRQILHDAVLRVLRILPDHRARKILAFDVAYLLLQGLLILVTDEGMAVIEVGSLGFVVVITLEAIFVQVGFLDLLIIEVHLVDIDGRPRSEEAVFSTLGLFHVFPAVRISGHAEQQFLAVDIMVQIHRDNSINGVFGFPLAVHIQIGVKACGVRPLACQVIGHDVDVIHVFLHFLTSTFWKYQSWVPEANVSR